jgi:hypothetical protein
MLPPGGGYFRQQWPVPATVPRCPARRKGIRMGWPWNGNTDDPIVMFPSLTAIQDDMKEVYRLFNSEADVTFCLETLCDRLDLESVETFQASLLQLEVDHKFSSQVVRTGEQLSSVEFMGYLGAKRPIHDLAFKDTIHGSSTHRIQFMMIALWQTHHPDRIKTPARKIYKAMAIAVKTGAKPDAQGNHAFEDVAWNHYFDVDPVAIGVNNACRPDYLCGTFIKERFGRLAAVAQ